MPCPPSSPPPQPGDGALFHDADGSAHPAILTRETQHGNWDLLFTTAAEFEQDSIRLAYNIPINDDGTHRRAVEHRPDADWADAVL